MGWGTKSIFRNSGRKVHFYNFFFKPLEIFTNRQSCARTLMWGFTRVLKIPRARGWARFFNNPQAARLDDCLKNWPSSCEAVRWFGKVTLDVQACLGGFHEGLPPIVYGLFASNRKVTLPYLKFFLAFTLPNSFLYDLNLY